MRGVTKHTREYEEKKKRKENGGMKGRLREGGREEGCKGRLTQLFLPPLFTHQQQSFGAPVLEAYAMTENAHQVRKEGGRERTEGGKGGKK